MGDFHGALAFEVVPSRIDRARSRAWRRRVSRAAASSKSTARNRAVRRRWLCTRSPKRRRPAAPPPLSTPSTRSIRPTRQALGVDLDNLLVSQPDTGEQALRDRRDADAQSTRSTSSSSTRSRLWSPKAELEGDMGDTHVGLQARLMSQALRKLTAAISRSEVRDDLHQPAAREDRRDVRQSRDDVGRPRAQVLRLDPPRRSQARDRSRSGKTSSARARGSRS